jgi:hypothetical protein
LQQAAPHLELSFDSETGDRQFFPQQIRCRTENIGALLVGSDPLFFVQRERILALAARHAY